jgi:hypothetical protein
MLGVVERARRITLDFAFGGARSPGSDQTGRGVIPTGRRTGFERFSQPASE